MNAGRSGPGVGVQPGHDCSGEVELRLRAVTAVLTLAAWALPLTVVFLAVRGFPAYAQSAPAAGGLERSMNNARDRAETGMTATLLWARIEKGDFSATKTLEQRARQGNSLAQNYMGVLLETGGGGLQQSSSLAVEWFAAADPQSPIARYNLGLAYYLGRGVATDTNRARTLFESALSEASIQQAAVYLSMLEDAAGNKGAARDWADRGAQMGNTFCFYLLGHYAYHGGDFVGARSWLDRAVSAREWHAAEYLDRIYSEGLGVQPNYTMALGWKLVFDALRHKADPARASLPSYASRMSSAEVNRARAFAQRWLQSNPAREAISYTAPITDTRSWKRAL